MITGIHHFSIIVSSESSIAFYERLGFKESNRITRDYDTVVLLEGFGLELVIFIDPNHPKRHSDSECIGIRNLSLKVDDIQRISKEFECGPVMEDWFGKKYCVMTDPDGLPIEFHE